MSKRFVRTGEEGKDLGPVGEYYDWCKLLENGSLAFGSEQGNYSGGTTLSYNFYSVDNMPNYKYATDHPVTEDYWKAVKEMLHFWKRNDAVFCGRILKMCKENNVEKALSIFSELEVEEDV